MDQRWEVFFDNPAQRPHEVFASKLTISKVRVAGRGSRATVAIDGLAIGPFSGAVEVAFYAGSPLVRIDAVVTTQKDRLAMFYDAGIVADEPSWSDVGWTDTEGGWVAARNRVGNTAEEGEVRNRVIFASSDGGAVALFPPPHQFQFPRDYSTNLGFVWQGRGYQGQTGKTGLRHPPEQGRRRQLRAVVQRPARRGPSAGDVLLLIADSLDDLLRSKRSHLTHGDQFAELPGYKTFTSHYHMAIAVRAMKDRAKSQAA